MLNVPRAKNIILDFIVSVLKIYEENIMKITLLKVGTLKRKVK